MDYFYCGEFSSAHFINRQAKPEKDVSYFFLESARFAFLNWDSSLAKLYIPASDGHRFKCESLMYYLCGLGQVT